VKISIKLAIGIIGVVTLIFLQEMVLSGKLPIMGDTVARVPINKWVNDYIEKESDIPQWFPHLFGGMPSYGGYIYMPADPVKMIFGSVFMN